METRRDRAPTFGCGIKAAVRNMRVQTAQETAGGSRKCREMWRQWGEAVRTIRRFRLDGFYITLEVNVIRRHLALWHVQCLITASNLP